MLLTEGVSQSAGQSPIVTWGILIVFAVAAIVIMRRSGNKRIAQIQEQRERMKASLTPGTWVRTTSGFYGKVFETSGDIVILTNLSGEESVWDIRAISEVKEPNFGTVSETGDNATEEESDQQVSTLGNDAETKESFDSNVENDDSADDRHES